MLTDGCDLTPCTLTKLPNPVLIPFGFDLSVEAGFVRGGQTLWSNVGAPVRLSELIATLATADDLADIARALGVMLLRRKAEADLMGGS